MRTNANTPKDLLEAALAAIEADQWERSAAHWDEYFEPENVLARRGVLQAMR